MVLDNTDLRKISFSVNNYTYSKSKHSTQKVFRKYFVLCQGMVPFECMAVDIDSKHCFIYLFIN